MYIHTYIYKKDIRYNYIPIYSCYSSCYCVDVTFCGCYQGSVLPSGKTGHKRARRQFISQSNVLNNLLCVYELYM